jgi:hypothetical protein
MIRNLLIFITKSSKGKNLGGKWKPELPLQVQSTSARVLQVWEKGAVMDRAYS